MQYQFFMIPANAPDSAQGDLNSFCASHCIATVEKQFVASGSDSFWSICVMYLDHQAED